MRREAQPADSASVSSRPRLAAKHVNRAGPVQTVTAVTRRGIKTGLCRRSRTEELRL